MSRMNPAVEAETNASGVTRDFDLPRLDPYDSERLPDQNHH